jgi:hypothetical protein
MHYIIAAHIIFSILLAYLGRNSRLKFWGVLLTSLYMTPLVVGVMLLFFGSSCPKPAKQKEENKKEESSVETAVTEKKARRFFSFRTA